MSKLRILPVNYKLQSSKPSSFLNFKAQTIV